MQHPAGYQTKKTKKLRHVCLGGRDFSGVVCCPVTKGIFVGWRYLGRERKEKKSKKRNSLKHRANGRYGYPTHIVARLLFYFWFLWFFGPFCFFFWLEGTSRGNWNVKTKKKSGRCRRANTCFIMRWKTTNQPTQKDNKENKRKVSEGNRERPLAGMRCFTVSLCVCVCRGLLMDSPPDWRPQTTARVCNREKK